MLVAVEFVELAVLAGATVVLLLWLFTDTVKEKKKSRSNQPECCFTDTESYEGQSVCYTFSEIF